MNVIPLSSGPMFKQVFSQPDIFCQFVKDVLDIEIQVDHIHTEYEYPKPVGFVKTRYDIFAEDKKNKIIVEIQQLKEDDFFDRFLYYHMASLIEQAGGYKEYEFMQTVYTIVVLTSIPRDKSIEFSCAISDMNPIDENRKMINVYPHRLVFLAPRNVNKETPLKIRKWLEFIKDSLDGRMETNHYEDETQQKILQQIYANDIDPELLAKIKDDAAWKQAKKRFKKEAREKGLQEGIKKGEEKAIQRNALAMLKKGLDLSLISEITGLPIAEIKTLK